MPRNLVRNPSVLVNTYVAEIHAKASTPEPVLVAIIREDEQELREIEAIETALQDLAEETIREFDLDHTPTATRAGKAIPTDSLYDRLFDEQEVFGYPIDDCHADGVAAELYVTGANPMVQPNKVATHIPHSDLQQREPSHIREHWGAADSYHLDGREAPRYTRRIIRRAIRRRRHSERTLLRTLALCN